MICEISYDISLIEESSPQQTPFYNRGKEMKSSMDTRAYGDRRHFIGGSDARIIMGADERALVRLWRAKKGDVESGKPGRAPNRPLRLGNEARHRRLHPQK